MTEMTPEKSIWSLATRVSFWTFNVLAAFIGFLVLMPALLTLIAALGNSHQFQIEYPLMITLLCLLPPLSMLIAVRGLQTGGWRKLLTFFCTIEYPIFGLILARCIFFEDLSLGLIVNEMVISVGIVGQAFLLFRKNEVLPTWVLTIFFLFQGVFFFFLVKISLLVLISIMPHLISIISPVSLQFGNPQAILNSFLAILLAGPITILLSILILFPHLALIFFSLNTLRESSITIKSRIGAVRLVGLSFTAVLAIFGIRELALRQPQVGLFDLLKNDFENPDTQELLLARDDEIRRGLLNAYLSPHRYFTDRANSGAIGALYRRNMNFLDDSGESGINLFYSFLAAEFIYEGDRQTDPTAAAQWYRQFFDIEIQEAERSTIRAALRSSLFGDQESAGLIDIDAQNVLLMKQEIDIKEISGLAEVQIHESYRSESYRPQEVEYHFSLPEDAVLTGLWLSSGNVPEKTFAFKVSPRGAAQATYQRSVAQKIDPALLEQVGPNVYRLRVYPIEQMSHKLKSGSADLHMWFSYLTAQNSNGTWPLPNLVERRNVYWDHSTERLVNGVTVENSEDWFPAAPGAKKSEGASAAFRVGPIDVTRTMLAEIKSTPSKPRSLAIVVDTSRSMDPYLTDIVADLKRISNAKIDYFRMQGSNIARFDPQDTSLRGFGNSSVNQLIAAYQQLTSQRDNLIILTDEGSYDKVWIPKQNLPHVYVVHWNKKYPRDYGDSLSAFLSTGANGTAWSIAEAMNRMDIFAAASDNLVSSYVRITDRSIWRFVDSGPAFSVHSGPVLQRPRHITDWPLPLGAIGAKEFIPYVLSIEPDVIKDAETPRAQAISEVHEIAVKNNLVTLFSSMIVLVTEQQHKALSQAEADSDKFEREAEDGIENLQGLVSNLSATPEPHEWTLFVLVVAALIAFVKAQSLNPPISNRHNR
jgi:putative PEP-CTERM system integral membrane protein